MTVGMLNARTDIRDRFTKSENMTFPETTFRSHRLTVGKASLAGGGEKVSIIPQLDSSTRTGIDDACTDQPVGCTRIFYGSNPCHHFLHCRRDLIVLLVFYSRASHIYMLTLTMNLGSQH
jgi:hypothetical protein